jgi:hypothetical protein
MKEKTDALSQTIAEMHKKNLTEKVQLNAEIQKLRALLDTKELDLMRINSDLEWANDRIGKLEAAMQNAVVDLKLKDEKSETREFQVGELQQKIIDLERFILKKIIYFILFIYIYFIIITIVKML